MLSQELVVQAVYYYRRLKSVFVTYLKKKEKEMLRGSSLVEYNSIISCYNL